MFNKGVSGVESISFGAAERVDMLVNFGQYMPVGVKNVYVICYDLQEEDFVMKFKFTLPWTS